VQQNFATFGLLCFAR